MRSRAAARSARRRARPDASTSAPTSTTCAGVTRSAPASLLDARAGIAPTRSSNYLGTYTFESLEAFRRGPAEQLHAAHRRSEPVVSQRCRARSTCRTTSALQQEPDADAGRPLRSCRRTSGDFANIGPRVRRHLGAVRRAARPRCAPAPACSTTGCRLSTYEQTLRDRRLPPAGDQHRQSGVSRSGRRRRRPAGQPLRARRRYRAPRHNAGQRRHRSGAHEGRRGYRRPTATARRRGWRAGANLNAPVDGVRPDPRVRATSSKWCRTPRRGSTAADRRAASIPARCCPVVKGAAHQLEAVDGVLQLHAGDAAEQHRRSVQPARDRTSRRVGPGTSSSRRPGFFNGGPSRHGRDVRSRLNVNFNNQIVRNLSMSVSASTPARRRAYTLLHRTDDNGDGIFNDRPAGVGRNTLRASGQTNVNMIVRLPVRVRPHRPAAAGHRRVRRRRRRQVRTFDQGTARYRLRVRAGAESDQRANYSATAAP